VVGADDYVQDVFGFQEVFGTFEALRWSEFVAGVERRGVASCAALLLKYVLAVAGLVVERIWVWWWFERVKVEGEGVELLVAVAGSFFGAESRRPLAWLEIPEACHCVQSLVDDGVSHDVADGTVTHEPSRIQILDILNANQRRNVRRVGGTRPLPGNDSGMAGRPPPNQFIFGERLSKLFFAHDPGGTVVRPEECRRPWRASGVLSRIALSAAADTGGYRMPWAPSIRDPSDITRVWHPAQEPPPTSNPPLLRTM
jgi:hypothetical protein